MPFSTLKPGEPANVRVHLRNAGRERANQPLSGEVRLQLMSGNVVVETLSVPVSGSVDAETPFTKSLSPGFYTVRGVWTEDGQSREAYQNGLWVEDATATHTGSRCRNNSWSAPLARRWSAAAATTSGPQSAAAAALKRCANRWGPSWDRSPEGPLPRPALQPRGSVRSWATSATSGPGCPGLHRVPFLQDQDAASSQLPELRQTHPGEPLQGRPLLQVWFWLDARRKVLP